MSLPDFTAIENSSNLKGVAYQGDVLTVQFLNGTIWRYTGVPEETFKAMMDADSKGSYFSREIRGKFSGEKLEAPLA